MTSDDRQARDGRTRETLPPGLYRRGGSLWMQYRVGGGREQREPVPADENGKQLSPRAAARLRSERITQLSRGEVVADSRRLTVGALLDAVLLDYELNRRGSIATARARLRILREAIGPRAAVTFATEDVQRLQVEWQRGGSRLGRSTGGAICSARRSDLLGAAGSSPASSTSLAWKSTRRAPSTSASARP